MSGGGNCCGNCGGCGSMILADGEIEMLQKLAQIPFLPVARRMETMDPMYFEDSEHTAEEYSLILQCLEKRGLICVDFDKPLKGLSSTAYDAYPIRGSFALTAKGQAVAELLEIQGIQ